ncbi:MAG TPA: NAD(P)/FAD-dependent oxidoreductase [Ktedonobacterales bacterium]
MAQIAIVGAGIAGLTAALTLQDAGLACAVYEAAEHVGGRMHSERDVWGDGAVSEWCGEFIDHDHMTLRHLAARFHLDLIELSQGRAGHGPPLLYLQDHFRGADDLGVGFAAVASIVERQTQAVGYPTTYARYSEEGYRLDHISVYAWIERHVAGGHDSLVGRYLDGGCTGFYGLDTHEQSALNLLYLVGSLRSSRSGPGSGPLHGSARISGGNQRLPEAIAASLPPGALWLGHRLIAIERRDDDALTLTFATADGDARIRCDAAMLTLPFSALRRVDYQRAGFDARKRAAIEQLGYGTISKLCLQFDTPYWYGRGPWPARHGGFVITDLDIQTLWDSGDGRPETPEDVPALLVNYTSGHHGAAYAPTSAYSTSADANDGSILQQYAQRCLRELERVFPGVSAHYTGRVALSYPPGDPNLLGSYACWRVGQYTAFGGYEGAAQGPIHFAGEHCSVEFQGYMEGAAREGERAAREIIHTLAGGGQAAL